MCFPNCGIKLRIAVWRQNISLWVNLILANKQQSIYMSRAFHLQDDINIRRMLWHDLLDVESDCGHDVIHLLGADGAVGDRVVDGTAQLTRRVYRLKTSQ